MNSDTIVEAYVYFVYLYPYLTIFCRDLYFQNRISLKLLRLSSRLHIYFRYNLAMRKIPQLVEVGAKV